MWIMVNGFIGSREQEMLYDFKQQYASLQQYRADIKVWDDLWLRRDQCYHSNRKIYKSDLPYFRWQDKDGIHQY